MYIYMYAVSMYIYISLPCRDFACHPAHLTARIGAAATTSIYVRWFEKFLMCPPFWFDCAALTSRVWNNEVVKLFSEDALQISYILSYASCVKSNPSRGLQKKLRLFSPADAGKSLSFFATHVFFIRAGLIRAKPIEVDAQKLDSKSGSSYYFPKTLNQIKRIFLGNTYTHTHTQTQADSQAGALIYCSLWAR